MSTLGRYFRDAALRYGARTAVTMRDAFGEERSETWDSLGVRGRAIAAALIDAGTAAGDRVGLFADHSPDWIAADWGIQFSGAVTVPRARDINVEEAAYIPEHAGIRIAFAADEAVGRRLREGGFAGRIVVFERSPGDGTETLELFEARGAALLASGATTLEAIDARIDGIGSGDLFTIIYTSGTTGIPKGVELTHTNIEAQIRGQPFRFSEADQTVSILPVWHSYERVFQIIALVSGVPIHISSVRTLASDIQTCRPTIMAGAPRLLESLHDRILARVADSGRFRRILFHLAIGASAWVREGALQASGQWLDLKGRGFFRRQALRLRGGLAAVVALVPHLILDRLVLAKVRAGFGGRLRAVISGGGALQPHIDRFFLRLGVPAFEGYGLTETAPVVAVRSWGTMVMGTVGKAYPRTDFRILDRETGDVLASTLDPGGRGRGVVGEIAVRGPQVMRGYHRDPEATAAVLDAEGWFRTGDLGMITFNELLRIVGRCKDTIVLSSGENVEPGPIERRLGTSPLIATAMVLGQDRKHLAALIVPSLDGFRAAGTAAADLAELVAHPGTRQAVEAEIRRLVARSSGLRPYEQVRRFTLLERDFVPGEEVTATFKLRRHVIEAHYRAQIEPLFS